MRVLSVDAWKESGSYQWNNWFTVGEISKEEFELLTTDRQLIKWFRDNDYITKSSAGRVKIEDDQYNIRLCDRDGKPLYAIEYGPHY
jgi:hypothetical protein